MAKHIFRMAKHTLRINKRPLRVNKQSLRMKGWHLRMKGWQVLVSKQSLRGKKWDFCPFGVHLVLWVAKAILVEQRYRVKKPEHYHKKCYSPWQHCLLLYNYAPPRDRTSPRCQVCCLGYSAGVLSPLRVSASGLCGSPNEMIICIFCMHNFILIYLLASQS